jgi:hypothetical protein
MIGASYMYFTPARKEGISFHASVDGGCQSMNGRLASIISCEVPRGQVSASPQISTADGRARWPLHQLDRH